MLGRGSCSGVFVLVREGRGKGEGIMTWLDCGGGGSGGA